MQRNQTVVPLEKRQRTEYRVKLSYVGYAKQDYGSRRTLEGLIHIEHHRQIVLMWADARRLWRHYAAISVYWSILVSPPFQ
jgi:hypothetical protein